MKLPARPSPSSLAERGRWSGSGDPLQHTDLTCSASLTRFLRSEKWSAVLAASLGRTGRRAVIRSAPPPPADHAARGVRPLGSEPPTARYRNETDYEKLDTERAYRAVAAPIQSHTCTARYGGSVFGPEGHFRPDDFLPYRETPEASRQTVQAQTSRAVQHRVSRATASAWIDWLAKPLHRYRL